MATSRRRTSKKSVGQNLNELERRVKAVERRPSPSYIQNSLIDSSAVAVGSITLDNLDPSLRAIILGSLSNNATTGSSFGETGVVVADNTSEVTFTSNRTASRTTVFYQTTEPDTDGRIDGDLWYDTDNDFKPYRWGFQTVSITQVVVSGSGSARSAVYTTSASHTITTDEILRVEGVTGSGGIDLLNGDWDITAQTSNTITVSIGSGTGITNGTYTGLSATGTSNLGEWFEAPFGDAALTSLTVGKLLTGTLNVATVATVGDPLAAGGTGTGGSIVISGGTGFTGIKLFKPDGTNTVFLDALTGDASFTGTITGSVFRTSANVGNGSTAGVLINSSGANFYNNSSATAVTSISASTGVLTATGANITGTLTATTGAIGGFNIGETTLYAPLSNPTILLDSGNSQIRLGLAGTGTANVIYAKADTGIWAGHHTFGSAQFSVSNAGALTATSATVTGTINASAGNFTSTVTIGSGSTSGTLAVGTNATNIKIVGTNTAATTRIYSGVGNYNNADTPLYFDASGRFSIRDQLSFDPVGTGGLPVLTVTGKIRGSIENLAVVSPNSGTISQVVISGTTTAVFTLTAAHSFVAGDVVIVTGLTGGAATANGTWTLASVSSSPSTITATITSGTNGTYTGQSGTALRREVTLGLHASDGIAPAGIGIKLDSYNYWFLDNKFRVGTVGSYVSWNGSVLEVTGTVNATAGNFKDKLTIGIAPTTASFGDNLNKSVYGPRELGIKLDPYNYWALIANPLSVAASGLSPVFYIGSADTNKPDYLEYDIQGDLTVSGTVLAVQGSDIGGWSVGNGLLYAGSGATFTAMSNETGSIPESGTLQMANIIVDDEFYFYFDPDLPEDLGEYSTIYITIPYSSDTTLGGLYENALTKYEGSTISFNSTLPTSPSLTYLQGSSFSVVKVLPGGYKLGTESPDKRVDEDFTTYPQATHFTLVVYGEDASPLPLVIGNTTNFTSGGLAHSSSTFTKTPNGRPTTSSTSGTSFVYDTVTYTTTTTHNYVEGEFVTVTGFTGTYAAVFNKTSAAITSVTTNTFTVANPYKDVRLATTANIASLSGAATVDGVAAVTGNRILVKNQTTASQNGIYVANTSGAWTRATDFDQATTGEVETGATIRVSAGNTLANTTWVLTTTGTITVGTTSLTFTQPASPQSSSGTGTITNLNIINISNGNTLPRPRPGMSISGTNIPAGPPTTKISLVETGNVIVHLDTPTTGSPGTTANSLTLGNVGDVSANTTALIAYDTYVSSDLGYFLWAGSEDPTTSPFSIKADGVINASSGTVGGWTLSSNAISQTLTDTNKSFLVELRAPTSITSSIDYLKGLAYNNIANDYYGLINISMRYDSLSSTLTPFINIVNKGIVDNAFSGEDGNLSTQNIYIYGRTPNSSLYSPVLRNLPSMTFDGPDGAIAGMLGAYNNKVFGIESVSGDSYINMNDLAQNTRGVIISSSGGTSNLNSAIISASGAAGIVSLSAYSGALICSIDLDASTRKIDSSGNLIRSLMAVRAYYDESGAATGTALTAGTYVSVRFNTENFNSFFTQGQFNTSASGGVRWYEVPYAGYYRVSGAAYFTGGGTAGRREVRVQLVDNGTTPTAATDGADYCHLVIPAGGVTSHSVVFSDVVYADESSDKIVVWARSVTDAGVELTEGSSRTFITIEYIGSDQ